MATKSTKSSSSSSSSKKKVFWGLNKISFYTICVAAFLYVIALILSAVGVNFKVVSAMQGVATAVMVCVVAVLAWRYVSSKPTVWKVLYVLCLLLVIVGIIVPLVIA